MEPKPPPPPGKPSEVSQTDAGLKIYFLPNLLTGANLFCGFVALTYIVQAKRTDLESGSYLDIKCWVNDELRQNANTAQLIFDIPHLIATISAGIELQAGDIIATGTPAGVGIGFDPPRFLASGDRLRLSVAGIGELHNTIE